MAAPGLGTDSFGIGVGTQNEAGENTAAVGPARERGHSSRPAGREGSGGGGLRTKGPALLHFSTLGRGGERELVLQKCVRSMEPHPFLWDALRACGPP